MRITGGILRGRHVRVPGGAVRPSTDMLREALFSILGQRIRDARFLDLFAGSGVVGLEAWSRGAAHVHFVELNPRNLAVLRENASTLCDSRFGFSRADAIRFSKKKLEENKFDIIFADPPYDKKEGESHLLGKLLDALLAGGMLRTDGLFIMEQGAEEEFLGHEAWSLVDDRVYGKTRLRFLKQKKGTEEV